MEIPSLFLIVAVTPRPPTFVLKLPEPAPTPLKLPEPEPTPPVLRAAAAAWLTACAAPEVSAPTVPLSLRPANEVELMVGGLATVRCPVLSAP